MKKMRKCASCGEYTLMEEHCGVPSVSAHPPKFNPNDPYAEYRRREKGIDDGKDDNH
ncbi:MAG: RNA-protein complex protein Nop10 [Candidatus Bilamarchaeaceae archaeon]